MRPNRDRRGAGPLGARRVGDVQLGDEQPLVLAAGRPHGVEVAAGEVGGAVWSAFTLALILALFTAFAYAELVTKYPQAGGAAVYVHGAFRRPFVTFMVAFGVMASGITSAATLGRAFAGD
jgi:amino acid transporter